jgi:hypothetical protein
MEKREIHDRLDHTFILNTRYISLDKRVSATFQQFISFLERNEKKYLWLLLDLSFFFCLTLSEFENFLLCERILINVTTCQNETSS